MSELTWIPQMATAPSVVLYRPELQALAAGKKDRLWLPVRTPLSIQHLTPGTLVWVKEKFAERSDVDTDLNPSKARHYAMIESFFTDDQLKAGLGPADYMNWHQFTPWQPPRKMPLALTQRFLKVGGARPLDPGAISEEDARAYGFQDLAHFHRVVKPRCDHGVEVTFTTDCPQP